MAQCARDRGRGGGGGIRAGVELRRWHWALGFALGWGPILGLVAWQTAAYNLQGSPIEWPFWSGMLAVLVATPLFQTRRDVAPDGRFWKLWTMPYERLHSHAWTDAVIGAASLAFVGIAFLLTVLIGQMFKLIGINLIFDLLNDEWFGWMLAGAAFGVPWACCASVTGWSRHCSGW